MKTVYLMAWSMLTGWFAHAMLPLVHHWYDWLLLPATAMLTGAMLTFLTVVPVAVMAQIWLADGAVGYWWRERRGADR
jgi:hypothetical protein